LVIYRKGASYRKYIGVINSKNALFLKNPIIFVAYRAKKDNLSNLLLISNCKYLFLSSFLALYSYQYILIFLKNFTNYRKNNYAEFSMNTYIINKIRAKSFFKLQVGYNLSYPILRKYSLYLFFDSYKFSYLQVNKYMPHKARNYLPPKKHVKLIGDKKKLVVFLQSRLTNDKNRIFKKLIKKVNKPNLGVIHLFNRFFLRNKYYFFKKILRILKKLNLRNKNINDKQVVKKLKLIRKDFCFVNRVKLNYKKINKKTAVGYENKKLRCL
jgi:hypothetical protein